MELSKDPFWINLNTFFGNSKSFTVDDPSIWDESIVKFKVECTISTPLLGEVTLLPNESGCLIFGTLSGKILLSCNRCTIDTEVPIKHTFKNFEPFPSINEDNDNAQDKAINSLIIRETNGIYEVSLAGILWEEFILSLPLHVLCNPNCKGICFNCGKDLNKEDCICTKDKVDPRFAVLKNLKINSQLMNHTKL